MKAIGWRLLDLIAGGIFIYAGILKARDPLHFANDIDNFHLLPSTFGVRLAFLLPWLEIVAGAAVVLQRAYAGGLAILTALTSVFIGASVIARMRGIDVSCGCFGGASSHLSFATHLLLDLAILGLLIVLGRRRAVTR